MAPRRFPIFSFPRTVSEQILQNVPVAELFEISLLSKRAFALVKNIPMTKCKVDVSLSTSSAVYAFCGNDETEWIFYGKRDFRRHELEDIETRTVSVSDGESGNLVFAKLSENCYGCNYESIQDVLQFAQWLCSLFNDNVHRLSVWSAQFQNLKAVQSVEVLKKSKIVHIWYGTVSHEEMVQVIEGFESKMLGIYCDPGPNFNYDRSICLPDFRVYTGSWAKGPMLLNFHSKKVIVMNADVAEEDAIAFLNRMLENQDGCGNVCTAFFFRDTKARESEFVYDDRPMKTWNLEKISDALSSYDQEISPTNLKRFWKRDRNNFIDVANEESDALILREGELGI